MSTNDDSNTTAESLQRASEQTVTVSERAQLELRLATAFTDKERAEKERDELREAAETRLVLVGKLDVIWNGEDGAAEQASLCDMVCQLEQEVPTLRRQLSALTDSNHTLRQAVQKALSHTLNESLDSYDDSLFHTLDDALTLPAPPVVSLEDARKLVEALRFCAATTKDDTYGNLESRPIYQGEQINIARQALAEFNLKHPTI